MSRSGDVKIGRARAKEICELPLNSLNVEMKAELIQALIVFGLWHVKAMLEHLGCTMLTAAEGEGADMVFREHKENTSDGAGRKIDGPLPISPQYPSRSSYHNSFASTSRSGIFSKDT